MTTAVMTWQRSAWAGLRYATHRACPLLPLCCLCPVCRRFDRLSRLRFGSYLITRSDAHCAFDLPFPAQRRTDVRLFQYVVQRLLQSREHGIEIGIGIA